LTTINAALQTATTEYSYLKVVDVSFHDATKTDGYIRYQTYEMNIVLDRTKIHNQPNMKQIVVFPDPTALNDANVPQLFTGQNSLYLFDDYQTSTWPSSPFNELNDIISESPLLEYSYGMANRSPYIYLRCTKYLYDNSYNNYKIQIAQDPLYGDFPYGIVYSLQSFINQVSTVLQNLNNLPTYDISYDANYPFSINPENQQMLFDQTINHMAIQFSMSKTYDQTAYTLDMSNCILHTILGLPATLDISDQNPNGVVFDSSFVYDITNTDPLFTIDNTNWSFNIIPKPTVMGLKDIPVYHGHFRQGTYNYTDLVNSINSTFSDINGSYYDSGYNDYTPLNGLNMPNTNITITQNQDDPNKIYYTVSLTYCIQNRISNTDYQVELGDDISESYPEKFPDNNNPLTNDITTWNYYFGFTETFYILSYSLFNPTNGNGYSQMYSLEDIVDEEITIGSNDNNNIFYLQAIPTKVGVYSSNNANDIKITIPAGIYTKYKLITAINRQFSLTPLTQGSTVSTFLDTTPTSPGFSPITAFPGYTPTRVKFRININKIYTAQDYTLTFYDQTDFASCVVSNQGVSSIRAPLWDTTLGWILGFHSYPIYDFSTQTSNQAYIENYIKYNKYTSTPNTNNTSNLTNNIITITSDATVNIFLYNQFYVILDDFTQNHLNDGVVTVSPAATDIPLPSYASRATLRCNPSSGQKEISLYRSDYGVYDTDNGNTANQLTTQKQFAAASAILADQQTNSTISPLSQPPFIKDMFAIVPMKLAGLQVGQSFVEYGGTLQDNDRKYFGHVNISRVSVRLLTDRGNVVDLNGADWSFSVICEQLYNVNGE
jgi:hypothetical protein